MIRSFQGTIRSYQGMIRPYQGTQQFFISQSRLYACVFYVLTIHLYQVRDVSYYARKGNWTDEQTGEKRSGVRSLPQHRYAISGEYASEGFTFRSEYIHSTGNAFAKTMTNTNDGSASDCNLSAIGNKADDFYALGIIPVVKNKVNVKARYDLYQNNAEWNSAKTFYEAGADYYFTKNLRLSAEYALVNDRNPNEHNYSLINTELSIKF